MSRAINGIELKEAENNQERMILGLLADEVARVKYGRITFEVIVHGSKITGIECSMIKKSVRFGDLAENP
jgi:hypothetical protein